MFTPLDEFARAALTAILTRSPGVSPEGAAHAAYKYADAMIEEQRRRNKQQIAGELKAQGWRHNELTGALESPYSITAHR